MRCTLCASPRKPRQDRPGKFFTVCVEHHAEYTRKKNQESYLRHVERRRQDKRDDREARPDVISEQKLASDLRRRADPTRHAEHNRYQRDYRRVWAKANRERVRAIEARWREAHRGQVREKNRARAALRRGATGRTTYVQMRARWEFYGGLCYLCGEVADTIDHVIPLVRGGTEWPANLRPACRSCNSSKGSRRL